MAISSQPLPRPVSQPEGILLLSLAVALFTLMGILIKLLGSGYSPAEVVLFRTAVALVPLWLYLRTQGGGQVLRTRRPIAHAVRTISGVAAMFVGFYTIPRMPYADYVAITFTAPLFATVLSVPVLGEVVGIRRGLAVAAGFLGVLLTVQPTGEGSVWIALLALLSSLGYAVAILAMRTLSTTDNSGATVFYFTAGGFVAALPFAPFEWTPPPPTDLALLVGIGLLGGVAQILMTEAYRHAPPAVLTPFEYTALVWAILLGFVLFGDFPAWNVLLGSAVIIGSGLYIWHRERRLGVAQPKIKRTSL